MKRYINFYHKFFLVATILATCTLTACDEAEELSFNGISLSEEQLDFGADGGKYTIALNASQEWTVMSDREWCLVNPANGNGSTTCEITVDSSYLYKEREAHLTFRCGKYSRQILIHQLGYEKVIKLDKDLLEVPDYTEYDKMFETVKVTSNISYDIEIEYDDPLRTDWIKVKKEDTKVGSIPRPSKIRIDYELYTESDKDRTATLIFKQKDVENNETPVETRLVFRQKKAQEIIPSREGDSLAILAIARIMKCAQNWDTTTPIIHWNNIQTEEVEYVNQNGETVDELRVVALRFSMFDTDKTIPYQIRKLDQLKTLILTGNTDAAGKNIVLEDDITYLPKLKSLGLLGYGISKLPERMKEMTQLEELELSGNNLTSIPLDIITALDKHHLKFVNMTNNRVKDVFGKLNENADEKDKLGLHGAIPEALFMLKNVEYLGLSYNYFEGQIPDMGYDASQYATEEEKIANNPILPQMEYLALNLNFLTGKIPDWILYHKNLKCWDPYTLIFNQFENGKDSYGKRVGFDNEPAYIRRSCPLWNNTEEEEDFEMNRANSFNAKFKYPMEFDSATGNYPILGLEGGWRVNYQPMRK
ncbi:MAG: hypothetical protein IIX35_03180 [Paraprevotella sp.]|jgi:Leucine-rich repeat (LRR) protein|nr:hypothetical protein [Paraprevotella sp.]